MNEFKAAVYQTAITQLKQKEALLAEERKNIIESILEEEKNSAGDKYETSRETMTQDLNSLEKQIKQGKMDLEELYRLQAIKDTPPTVQEGALVQLGADWFLLAVSIGQVKVADKQVFLLSKNSSIFPKSYVSFLRIFLKVCAISELLIHFPRAIINVPAQCVILSNVVSESIFKMTNIAITELINAPAIAIELVFKPLAFHDNLISIFSAVVSSISASLLNNHSILILAHC
jgi:hypothetical protein